MESVGVADYNLAFRLIDNISGHLREFFHN